MIPYLLHVSCLVALCYLFYRILLAKETYFQLNRWILLGALLLAFTLPLFQIPQQWTWRKAATPMVLVPVVQTTTEVATESPAVKTEIPVKEEAIQPEIAVNQPVITQVAPAPAHAQPLQLSLWLVLKYAYLSGLVILGLNFLIQLISIAYKRFTKPSIKDGPYNIVELDQDHPPFSFWNSLFINPEKYDWETYNQIIQHEKVHLAQRHSFDILLAEILVIVQWFNPLAWLYRKAIEDNLEYLTDATVLQAGTDKSAYQMNLLQVAVPSFPLSPVNNYNQSTLKKRIIMMNAKKSSLRTSWKYLFLLPILGLATVALNPIKTAAAITEKGEDMQQQSNLFHNSAFAKSGIWSAKIEGAEICFTFNNSAGNDRNWWSSSQCFAKSDFPNLPIGQEGEFQLAREAGTITFKGKFENGEGLGRFSFTESATFRAQLEKEGYKDIKEELMFHFALNNFNGEYLTFLKDSNLKPKSRDELSGVAFHLPPLTELKKDISEYKAYGFGDFKLEELIAMNIHDMSPEYIKSMSDAGYNKEPFEKLLAAKIHDVSPEYIKEMQAAGFDKLSLEEITQLSIHDVDTEFVKSLADAGFTNLSREEVLQASIHDVDPEYIKQLQASGFKDVSLQKAVQMSIHDVDADYVQKLQAMGFSNLTEDQIMQASIHDVSPEYMNALKAAGFTDLPLEKVIQMSIHDVDADYVQKLKAMGFNNLTEDQIMQASIHGVSPEYMKALQAAGFKDLSFDKVVQMSIHDVDADFVNKLKQAGFTDLSEDEILQASIHGVKVKDLDDYKQLGFDKISIERLIQLNIHDVTPKFIKEARAKGFEDLDLEEYVRLKIMGLDDMMSRKGKKREE
ncbi:MAG: hypothetical protein DHS20C18_46510 [Saprospiraceae bacterium]|nr:MAG: hypothetical protein DHS20C18_46510 [Saprospiraceae bacterium]